MGRNRIKKAESRYNAGIQTKGARDAYTKAMKALNETIQTPTRYTRAQFPEAYDFITDLKARTANRILRNLQGAAAPKNLENLPAENFRDLWVPTLAKAERRFARYMNKTSVQRGDDPFM